MINIHIPNLLEPHEDELIYSYACRLARENGLSSLNNFIARLINKETDCNIVSHTPLYYDGYGIFGPLFTALQPEKQPTLIQNCSMYPIQSIFLTPEQQEFTVNKLFNSTKYIKTNTFYYSFIKKYKYCIKCMEEDIQKYGYYYLHRIHQIPGVKTCNKHHLPLFTSDGTQEQLAPNEIADAIEYTKFSTDLLYSNIQTNYLCVVKALTNVLTKDIKIPTIIKDPRSKTSKLIYVISKLMDTFHTVNKFKTIISEESENTTKQTTAKNKEYEIISLYNETIINVKHKPCGTTFYTTPKKLFSKPVCLICDKTHQANNIKFKKKVAELVGDEYTVIGQYFGEKIPIKIRHNKCKYAKTYKPIDFLKGDRCSICSAIITENKANELISAITNNQYKIIGKRRKNYYKIQEENGKAITTTIKQFLQECRRPTPSTLLPVPIKNLNTELIKKLFNNDIPVKYNDTNLTKHVTDYLNSKYNKKDFIFIEDLYKVFEDRISKNQWDNIIKNIKNKILFEVGFGIYILEPRNVEPMELITQKYICRNGKIIGIFNSKSLAYEMGILEEKPDKIYVLCNKKKGEKLANTTYSAIYNETIRGIQINKSLSPVVITNQNYKYIMVLQALRYCNHYGTKNIPKIKLFIEKNNLALKNFEPLLQYYTTQVQNNFNKLKVIAWPEHINPIELIEQKYICQNSKRIGIYNNKSLAYQMGILEEKPDKIYVLCNNKDRKKSTNSAYSTYYTTPYYTTRYETIYGINIYRNVSPVVITNQNYKYVMVLQALRYCNYYGIKNIPKILPFIEKNNLTLKNFEPLLQYYTKRVQKNFNRLKVIAWPESQTEEKLKKDEAPEPAQTTNHGSKREN